MIQEAFRRRMRASDLRRSHLREGEQLRLGSLPGGARAAFAASLLELEGPAVVVVAATPGEAEAVHADLEFLLGPSVSRYFPQRETLPYEDTDPHVEITGQRIDALAAMLGGRTRLLVTTARGLVERSPIPSRAEGFSIQLRVGGETALDQLAERLARSGFDRVHTVQELGEFAVRGGIVDVFPFGSELPVRIELWGDEDLETYRGRQREARWSLVGKGELLWSRREKRMHSFELDGELDVTYHNTWSYSWDNPRAERFDGERTEEWNGTLVVRVVAGVTSEAGC